MPKKSKRGKISKVKAKRTVKPVRKVKTTSTRPKKTEAVRNVTYSNQRDSVEKVRHVLHNIWFSKDSKSAAKPVVSKAAPKVSIASDMRLPVDNQKSTDLEKRINNLEQSITIMRDFLVELRRENEDLRRDRQMLFDKLNSAMEKPRWTVEPKEEYVEQAVEEKQPVAKEAGQQGDRSVKTSMDQLLEMVNEKGSIKLTDVAKKLHVKDKQIEDWARMLEEHGLLEIHYPAMGKPILKKK